MSNACVFKYSILLIFSLTMSSLSAQKMEESDKEQLIPNKFYEQIGFLKEKGMKTVLWSVSKADWDSTRNSSEEIQRTVLDNLFPGAIVLMHDFDPADNSDAGSTRDGMLKGLEQILIKCKRMGYEFVTNEELSN